MATLTIRFTGLCLFVPDKPWSEQPARCCVLLPDLRGPESKKSLENLFTLDPHFGFLRRDTRSGMQDDGLPSVPKSTEVIYLQRKRVWIERSPDSRSPLDLKLDAALAASEQIVFETLQSRDDMALLANFEKICPGLGSVAPSNLGVSNVPNAVWAQILVDTGRLRAGKLGNTLWQIPGSLRNDGKSIIQPLATEVHWTLPDLNSAVIHLVDIDTGIDELYQIDFEDSDSEVELTIVNVCKTNPLEWDISTRLEDDEDFVWHYELLDDSNKLEILRRLLRPISGADTADLAAVREIFANLSTRRHSLSLPYPRVLIDPNIAPSGDNCKGGGAAAADLDRLWSWLDAQRS